MVERISINFESPSTLSENTWARIDVIPATSDFVSLSDAATVIDSIYDIDSCNSVSNGGEEALTIDEDEIIPKLSAAFGSISYDPCVYDGNYAYKTTVYVYRSHLKYPYKLVINDGIILSTKKIEKRITTLVLADEKVIDTKYPIVGSIICDLEIESFQGSQALLKDNYALNFSFSYMTEYDEVVIQVNGDCVEAQDAVCIAFYNGLAYTATVSQPDEDAEAIAALGCTVNWSPTERVVEPESEDPDPVIEVEPEEQFDACHDDEPIQDPLEFYVETCCNPPDFDDEYIPTCLFRRESWLGGAPIVKGADFYINNALTGETVILVPVGPADGVCGTIETFYDVVNSNCCDDPGLTAVEYDTENSADVIADNSSGDIYWSGGSGTYDLSIRGEGFYFDVAHTKRDIQVVCDPELGCSATVFTANACGKGNISIDDGCSSDLGYVRSDDGQWVLVEDDLTTCPYPGASTSWAWHGYTSKLVTGVAIINGFRVTEYITCKQVNSFSCTDGNVALNCANYADEGVQSEPQLGGFPWDWPCADLIPTKYVWCMQVTKYKLEEWVC